jgi:hypothetical protein
VQNIYTPSTGKKIRLKGFAWSSNADIETALRFGTGGDLEHPMKILYYCPICKYHSAQLPVEVRLT